MSDPVHSDTIQKVAPPAFLHQRLETFQIGKGGKISYLLKDKVLKRNFDLESWQFFVLEVLPGCENFVRLSTAFQDRFGRPIERGELENFYAQIADGKLFNESAVKHPLLLPFVQPAYRVEDGKAASRSSVGSVTAGYAAWDDKAAVGGAPEPAKAAGETAALQAGIRDVVGLDPQVVRAGWRLFDPRPLLGGLIPLLAALKYATYVLPLLLLAALFIAVLQAGPLLTDVRHLCTPLQLAVHVAVTVAGFNILVTLTLACFAHVFRGTVGDLGIVLRYGIVPGLAVRVTHTAQMSRRERIWLHAGPLLVRLALFSIGMLLWNLSRDHGGEWPKIGLGLLLTGAADLVLLSGNPLMKSNLYFLLSAFVDEPKLHEKVLSSLNRLRKASYQRANHDAVVAYGLVIAVYLLALVCLGLAMAANALPDFEVGGSLVVLLAALGIYVSTSAYGRLKKVDEAYDRSQQFSRWKDQAAAAESEAAANANRGAAVDFSTYARRAAPLMLLILLLLPYPYEPGGNLVIYPMQKVQIAPDVDGIISDIYFDGGEWVKKGTPIARMKDDDNQAKLLQLDASVKEQEAVIDNLKTLPKPEAVKLAQSDVVIAQTQEQFSREKEPRIFKLYQQGGVSLDEYNTAKKQHDDDVGQVAQKIAQLRLVQAGPTADEIKAAEAQLEALKAERDDYQDKVNRAVLYMPFDGQIMTMHLKDKTNMYLERGKFFAAVEDSSKMTVEIDVPERDIGFVKVGQKVRARPQAYNSEDFDGTVTSIDPNVTTLASGNIVKVIAVIVNKDGKLKSGMSGYAKTSGQTMPVWRAFSLALLDFFNVDIWSWIP